MKMSWYFESTDFNYRDESLTNSSWIYLFAHHNSQRQFNGRILLFEYMVCACADDGWTNKSVISSDAYRICITTSAEGDVTVFWWVHWSCCYDRTDENFGEDLQRTGKEPRLRIRNNLIHIWNWGVFLHCFGFWHRSSKDVSMKSLDVFRYF